MAEIAPQSWIDPLAAFAAGAFADMTRRPVPLISTSFEVEIVGGLATVTTKRRFRNDEAQSIEATITFPVPVHAVLFALEARIGGRVLNARAQRREQARETYEDAVDRGKAAILHEEVLRGVHMLSVAHLAPGAEIELSSTWATALSFAGDRGQLRIPLTVGDIYGRSPLPDSDDLVHASASGHANLVVRCDGEARLLGGRLENGRARVPLDAPIDLVVGRPSREALCGRTADGREVTLRIRPHAGGDRLLNAALLIDHSGSMAEACSEPTGALTKHQAIVLGLESVAQRLREADSVDLWEFDTAFARLGSTRDGRAYSTHGKRPVGERLLELVGRLSGPAGGTEIGGALAAVIDQTDARDVLLVTDGKSHSLDIQDLARRGRRISVVLVGEDSLEANVGHLAALTGGDILVAAGADVAEVLVATLESLRAPFERPQRIDAPMQRVRAVRGNATLEAEWREPTASGGEGLLARAVSALAASLALSSLDDEAASRLAAAEGLVTHLTSLVFVDEAAEAQEGLPATRKVPLPTPRTSPAFTGAVMDMADHASIGLVRSLEGPILDPCPSLGHLESRRAAYHDLETGQVAVDLSRVGGRIDWAGAPNRLHEGDLSPLDPDVASLIERVAALPQVVAAARRLNLTSVVLVLALLARAHAASNRTAARFARTILGPGTSPEIEALGAELGLAYADSRHSQA